MRTLLLLLLLFSCNKVETFEVSDCGTTIESPYLADDLIFDSDLELTIALRFIQVKKTPHESSIDIDSSIDSLNKCFKPSNIRFVSIEVDSIYIPNVNMEDYKNHILTYKRENHIKLPAIDIFVYPVNLDYYPGIAMAIKSDGVAIQRLFLNTNTLVHELGHCLGLSHTHTGSGNGYDKGDFICDTPDARFQVDYNCQPKPSMKYSKSDMEIIIRNYMTYVNRSCRKEFTQDQIDKMRFNLAKEPMLRNTLIF